MEDENPAVGESLRERLMTEIAGLRQARIVKEEPRKAKKTTKNSKPITKPKIVIKKLTQPKETNYESEH